LHNDQPASPTPVLTHARSHLSQVPTLLKPSGSPDALEGGGKSGAQALEGAEAAPQDEPGPSQEASSLQPSGSLLSVGTAEGGGGGAGAQGVRSLKQSASRINSNAVNAPSLQATGTAGRGGHS
jgi:hypothetical protein